MSRTEFETAPRLAGLFARAALPGGRRGEVLPAETYTLAEQRIDGARLASYQRVCGFRISYELPVTYLHVLAFPLGLALMGSRSFPLPLVGLVHVKNVITAVRPLQADEPVSFAVRAENLRPHRSGRQFDLHVEARSDGEVVWTARSTYLHREGRSAGDRRRSETEPWTGPAQVVRVPGDIGRRYARVSGDRNPIHLSAVTAKPFGFPRAIAHGMWLAARTLAALTGRLPDVYSFETSFKVPVLLPATVQLGTRPTGSGWVVDVRDRRTGRPHLSGTVEAR